MIHYLIIVILLACKKFTASLMVFGIYAALIGSLVIYAQFHRDNSGSIHLASSTQFAILMFAAPLVNFLCLTIPLLASVILLVWKKFRAFFIVFGVYVALIGPLVIYAQFHRREASGRWLRSTLGAGSYRQHLEDDVEDLQHSSALLRLQEWSVKTMERFRSGQVATNGAASYWSLGDIQIASSEIPQFISTPGIGSGPPEVSIKLSPNKQPERIVLAWYSRGVLLGKPSYHSTLTPDCQKQVTNGVYVYDVTE
jgi:hypothetical protein